MSPAGTRRRSRGFSLIVTVFVILVLAALGVFAVRIGVTQQQSVDFDLLNARAQAAAASGIEYGAYQALVALKCPPPSKTLHPTATGLTGFTVTVTCSPSMHTVSGASKESYLLSAVAQRGVYGSPDFVQASATRSVNNAPP
ncbi:MAG: type II secretion system protein [Steroidobacteraceae bacterium]